MSIEVACPACGGSIQIEEVSEIVACPLCEVHLEINPDTQEPVLITDDSSEEVASPEESDETTEPSDSAMETEAQESAAPAIAETEAEQTETDDASPFAFLPGGNNTKKEKAKPVRPATNFDFLPGGSKDDSEEATAEEAIPEVDTETPEETLSTEPESDSEEDVTEETTSEETTFEEPAASEADTEETNSDEVTAEEQTTEEAVTEETTTDETATDEAATQESITEEAETTEPNTEETATTDDNSKPEEQAAPENYRKPKVVPKQLFTLTLTYAITATILVALLLYARHYGDPHQLESLPDLKPPIKNDEIALQLVPENAQLPAGHTLKLGGPGRRFGNVLVTPLRVTRGPMEFEHYTGDTTKTREPSKDVLKLHLKFENVSRDQTFEPLDQKLLLSRVPGKTPESPLRANNFLGQLDQKHPDAKRVLVYDMPPSWEWNLKGQNINQEEQTQKLEPGESFETYIATNEEGIDALTGELVWRVQIRKGYNPKSFRGVTTLVDVLLNSDQIETETPAPKKESLPPAKPTQS